MLTCHVMFLDFKSICFAGGLQSIAELLISDQMVFGITASPESSLAIRRVGYLLFVMLCSHFLKICINGVSKFHNMFSGDRHGPDESHIWSPDLETDVVSISTIPGHSQPADQLE